VKAEAESGRTGDSPTEDKIAWLAERCGELQDWAAVVDAFAASLVDPPAAFPDLAGPRGDAQSPGIRGDSGGAVSGGRS